MCSFLQKWISHIVICEHFCANCATFARGLLSLGWIFALLLRIIAKFTNWLRKHFNSCFCLIEPYRSTVLSNSFVHGVPFAKWHLWQFASSGFLFLPFRCLSIGYLQAGKNRKLLRWRNQLKSLNILSLLFVFFSLFISDANCTNFLYKLGSWIFFGREGGRGGLIMVCNTYRLQTIVALL